VGERENERVMEFFQNKQIIVRLLKDRRTLVKKTCLFFAVFFFNLTIFKKQNQLFCKRNAQCWEQKQDLNCFAKIKA
jgi:hypothetical protein